MAKRGFENGDLYLSVDLKSNLELETTSVLQISLYYWGRGHNMQQALVISTTKGTDDWQLSWMTGPKGHDFYQIVKDNEIVKQVFDPIHDLLGVDRNEIVVEQDINEALALKIIKLMIVIVDEPNRSDPEETNMLPLTESTFRELKNGDQIVDNTGAIWDVRSNTMFQKKGYHGNLFRLNGSSNIFHEIRWDPNDGILHFDQNQWLTADLFTGPNVRMIKAGTDTETGTESQQT